MVMVYHAALLFITKVSPPPRPRPPLLGFMGLVVAGCPEQLFLYELFRSKIGSVQTIGLFYAE